MRIKPRKIGKPDETLKKLQEIISQEHLKISAEFVYNFLKTKYWKRLGHKDDVTNLRYVAQSLNAQYCSRSSKALQRPLITPPKKQKKPKGALKSKKPKKEKWISYDEQLQDPRWLEFREKVFKARGRVCEHCGSIEVLQVHHPKYIHGKKAWEYSTDEVIVLCKKCHEKEHHIDDDKV